jgi:hypothetical protein
VSFPHIVAILAAGAAAGAINAVVGSGTLITFPVLLAFGYAPVVANVTNTVGIAPGSVAGAVGYRRELRGQGRRALPLALMSLTGAISGAVALLLLPASAFKAIVPVFIAIALVLIVLQPTLSRALAARRAAGPESRGRAISRARRPAEDGERVGPVAMGAVFVSGVYGGYFGAAQGILLLSILGLAVNDELQRINALKNVLAGLVNLVAGVVFVIAAQVAWLPAALLAAGSITGGVLGAHGGRRLPDWGLRAVIVVVGIAAIVKLVS